MLKMPNKFCQLGSYKIFQYYYYKNHIVLKYLSYLLYYLLQIQKPIEDILSKDPALAGYDTSKFLFTDITFGVDNAHRLIVER